MTLSLSLSLSLSRSLSHMTFSISALVFARDFYIKSISEDGGLTWVDGWNQGQYRKFHIIIFLSSILHWPLPSIDKVPGGSVVGLHRNSYKPITNMAWVRAQLCKLQKGCTRLATASDKVYQLLVHGRWFCLASSISKTGRHDIAEILLKVALNTTNQIKHWLLYCKKDRWTDKLRK